MGSGGLNLRTHVCVNCVLNPGGLAISALISEEIINFITRKTCIFKALDESPVKPRPSASDISQIVKLFWASMFWPVTVWVFLPMSSTKIVLS